MSVREQDRSSRQETARVLENRRLSPEVLQVSLRLPGTWPVPTPGQFVEIECLPEQAFVLKRPFSIARVRPGELGTEIRLVYSPVGRGTEALARKRAGETVTVVGPLGNGFRPVPGRNPVLVGGGRGIAPLLALADYLRADYEYGTILFGVRRGAQLYPLEEVPYPVRIATEDGSEGFTGNLIALLDHLVERGEMRAAETALFACGPNGLLHALSEWAKPRGFPVQVSLETLFGCGFGICAGCAVPVVQDVTEHSDEFGHYRFACIDGPVFDGTRVDWEGVLE